MTRSVSCLVRSIPIVFAALTGTAGADDAPFFVDVRDVISWDAGRSIGALGDMALEQIRAHLRIVQPAMPAYESGSG